MRHRPRMATSIGLLCAVGACTPTREATAFYSLNSQDKCTGLAVDGTNLYVAASPTTAWYNPNSFELQSPPLGSIVKKPLKGGEVTTLLSYQARTAPLGMAINSTHLYWVDHRKTVWKMPLAGGDSVSIGTGDIDGDRFSLAASDRGVYWTKLPGIQGELPDGTMRMLPTWATYPKALAFDAERLYWQTSKSIETMPIAGGDVSTLVLEEGYPYKTGINIDEKRIYWTASRSQDAFTSTFEILSLPLAGGDVTTLLSRQSSSASSVGFDSTGTYAAVSGEIVSLPKSGGTISTLITDSGAYGGPLVVSAEDVFYVGQNQTIMKVAK